MSQLAPSMLAADFNCLGKQIRELEENQVKMLHVDVMDGMFVPSISFGMPVIESIRKESSLLFDVHLMVQEPIRYVEEFVKAGADSLTVHVEACEDVAATLKKIKEFGKKCAISLNPDTPVEEVFPYLADKLGISEAKIYGVATFYENFSLEQKGKYVIKVCDGTACHVRHSVPILNALRQELGLSEEKKTTDDLMFTVETVACLGACSSAPAITLNNEIYPTMTPESAVALVKSLKENA